VAHAEHANSLEPAYSRTRFESGIATVTASRTIPKNQFAKVGMTAPPTLTEVAGRVRVDVAGRMRYATWNAAIENGTSGLLPLPLLPSSYPGWPD
jgi:hypothetical protein